MGIGFGADNRLFTRFGFVPTIPTFSGEEYAGGGGPGESHDVLDPACGVVPEPDAIEEGGMGFEGGLGVD